MDGVEDRIDDLTRRFGGVSADHGAEPGCAEVRAVGSTPLPESGATTTPTTDCGSPRGSDLSSVRSAIDPLDRNEDLGGIAGADKICQDLAAAAGAGNKTWHAYMSQEQRGNTPRINARGRIGQGPWFNAKGALIASNVADLHGDNARDRNNIKKATALDEKGNEVNGVGNMPNVHDMLTGSDSDGRAFIDGLDHTCNNWTSNTDANRVMMGHHDRNGGANTSWNSAHMSQGCSKIGRAHV